MFPDLYRFPPPDSPAFDLLNPYNLLGGIGCVMWIAAYLRVIQRNHQDRACGIPAVAVVLNFGWEFMATLMLPENPVRFWHWVNVFWLGLDVVILAQLLKYGARFQSVPELKRWFRWIVVMGAISACLGQYAFVATFNDRLGIMAAFTINLVMSIAFVGLFFARREKREGLSLSVAWLKMGGTLLSNIECHFVCRIINPEMQRLWYLTWIGVVIFGFDALYIYLLSRRQGS